MAGNEKGNSWEFVLVVIFGILLLLGIISQKEFLRLWEEILIGAIVVWALYHLFFGKNK